MEYNNEFESIIKMNLSLFTAVEDLYRTTGDTIIAMTNLRTDLY